MLRAYDRNHWPPLDLAFVFEVLGQIHGCHATLTEMALDLMPVGKRGREAASDFGHVRIKMRPTPTHRERMDRQSAASRPLDHGR